MFLISIKSFAKEGSLIQKVANILELKCHKTQVNKLSVRLPSLVLSSVLVILTQSSQVCCVVVALPLSSLGETLSVGEVNYITASKLSSVPFISRKDN